MNLSEVPHSGCDPVMLADLIRHLAIGPGGHPHRVMIGVAGAPGAGKSTLAAQLAEQLGSAAALVPMDGFHLAQSVLRRRGLADVKGAPETFDGFGFSALLQRLRGHPAETVYAPTFDRELEQPVAGAIEVTSAIQYVITEGNYLLLDGLPWEEVKGGLDAVWYLDTSEAIRVNRLVRRHIQFGRTPNDALKRATNGSDADNAVLVRESRNRADLILVP